MSGATSRIPRHPSNRSFFEMMVQWGWEPGKTDGQFQSMFTPPIITGRERVRVRPSNHHLGNPTSTFLEVYRLTTGGDAELFWRGPSEMWLQMLANETAAAEERKRAEAESSMRRARERAEAQRKEAEAAAVKAAVTVVEPKPEPEPEPERSTMPKQSTKTPAMPRSKQVLEVLCAHDVPMTVARIVAELGLPNTSDTVRVISNRCGYLAEQGLAERVMYGTYRVADKAKRTDVRVHHDSTPSAAEAAPAPSPVTVPVVAEPRNVVTVAESVDDTIEAVLDLLLPDGFKASHLRYIAPWVEATKQMVSAVSNG